MTFEQVLQLEKEPRNKDSRKWRNAFNVYNEYNKYLSMEHDENYLVVYYWLKNYCK